MTFYKDKELFNLLHQHIGHEVDLAPYGKNEEVDVVCMDCWEILIGVQEKEEEEEDWPFPEVEEEV